MAISLAAAAIGSAVIGAGSSIIAGNKAAKAQKNAAAQQVAEQRRQYDQDRADLAPWRDAGGAAVNKMAGIYGLSGGTKMAPEDGTGAYGGFFESPGFKFRRDEALRATERAASAGGLLNSGAAKKALMERADNMASAEYGDWWNRLAGIAGVGQAATNSTVQAGQIATQGITAAQQAAGNARASSYANTGSAINSGINNVLSAYMFNKGGGFGGGVPQGGRT